MTRLSNASFVPPSVYIEFPVFLVADERLGQLSATGGVEEPLFVDPLWREPHRVIQGILF